jgi:hypothetical protein
LKLPFIKLDRNASIIAVLAFLISITQLAVQLYRSSAYPRLEVVPPNEVYFTADFDPKNLDKRQETEYIEAYTWLVATLVYYHPGSSSRNAVLMSQSATVSIGDRSFRWLGKQLGRFEQPERKWTFIEEGALPVLIKPEEAVRTQVLFAPRTILTEKTTSGIDKNFLLWEEFLSLADRTKKIHIRIDSEFAGHRHVTTDFDLHLQRKYYRHMARVFNASRFDVVGSPAEQTELSGK